MMKKILPFALLLMLTCASSVVKIKMYKPAQDVLWGIKKVALSQIKGEEKVSSFLHSLISVKLQQSHYFTFVENKTIEDNLKAANLNLDDFHDLAKSNEVCQALDTDAILYAEVDTYQVAPDEYTIEKISKAIWTGKYERDQEGKIIEENIDGKSVKKKLFEEKIIDQEYVIRRGSVSVTFHLVDGRSGKMAISTTVTKIYDSGKVPIELTKTLPEEDKITRDLASGVITEFVDSISPKEIFVKRKIESGEGFVEEGKIYAISSLWKEALDAWLKAERIFPNNPGVYYNLGLAYEALGDYEVAEVNYKKALLLKEDKKYIKAANSLRKAQEKKEKRLKPLLEIFPPENIIKGEPDSSHVGERK